MKNACSICAVVPAAGRGSRLGLDIPKVFVSLLPSLTIWDALHEKLARVAGRIVLVLSPEGNNFVAGNQAAFAAESFSGTVLACQNEPLGMGDAIFGAADFWRDAGELLIVWGDQFNLSSETLRGCVELHAAQKGPALTLPVVRVDAPYVEYVFDSAERLTAVRQSREGDVCAANGFADMGVFLLTGGEALLREWERYRAGQQAGAATGEINFLPFLVHLSSVAGWPVARYERTDSREALGINTPEDLELAREIVAAKMQRQN